VIPCAPPPVEAERIPRGPGNSEIRDRRPFAAAARQVADAILAICKRNGWHLSCIAIDAPAAPPKIGPRACEKALRRAGLSVFQTPSREEWTEIAAVCRQHLDTGGDLSRLPYANKIWMLYGFHLFAELRARTGAEIIEVYPYAIAHRPSAEGGGSPQIDGDRL